MLKMCGEVRLPKLQPVNLFKFAQHYLFGMCSLIISYLWICRPTCHNKRCSAG
jgi:hypothetical protein